MLDNYLDELSRATRTNGSKNCPNCGAPIETEKCPYCGTTLYTFVERAKCAKISCREKSLSNRRLGNAKKRVPGLFIF